MVKNAHVNAILNLIDNKNFMYKAYSNDWLC